MSIGTWPLCGSRMRVIIGGGDRVSIGTWPLCGSRMRVMSLRVVLLPLPEGPTIATF